MELSKEVTTLLVPTDKFMNSGFKDLDTGDTFKYCERLYYFDSYNYFPFRSGLIELWCIEVVSDEWEKPDFDADKLINWKGGK